MPADLPETSEALAGRLIPQMKGLVALSARRDTRAEVAALADVLDSVMARGLLTLDLAIVALDVFLLFRKAAVARRIVAYLRAAAPNGALVARVAGYLAADEPSEADMTRAAYALKAACYDRLYETSHRELEQALDRLTPRLGLARAGRIADLGCGTGLVGRHLRGNGFTGELIGVDLSREMLDQTEAQGGYDRLVCDDLLHYLEGDDSGLDMIVAMQVVAMLDRDGFATFAARARARLTAGGVLLFNAPYDEELPDAEANRERVCRLGPTAVEALLRRHRLSFRASHHANRRYYLCVVRP